MSALPVAGGRAVLSAARAELRGHRAATVAALVLTAAGAATGLVTPWALGRIVDAADRGGDTIGQVWILGAAMVAAAVLGAVFLAAGQILVSRVTETALAGLRERMLRTVLGLPRSVVERAGSGDVVARLGDDVSVVAGAVPQIVPALGFPLFTVAATAVGVTVLDWRFAVVLLVVLPIHLWTVRWYSRTAPGVYLAERAAMADRAHHLLSALHGLDTVHAFGLSARHTEEIAAASWRVARWSLRARVVQSRFFGRLNLAELLGTGVLLVVGFVLVRDGLTSLGAATAALLMFLRLFNPINELLLVVDDLQSAAASLSRIVGVIDLGDRTPPAGRSTGVPGDGIDIAVQQVRFGYDDRTEVLRTLDLQLARGETVAVVGASGAGKSTLAALVAGVHEPGSGLILRRPAAADRAVFLTQETYVFAGTLRDNLTLVAPGADDGRLVRALEAARAHDLLELPGGLGAAVGDGGQPLTAAQSQHLALARAFLEDPILAILDEPTAEAGSSGAARLDAATAELLRGRTGLVVAHRLDQAQRADRILVMDDGRIVEQGSHRELLQRNGSYARLWQQWERGRSDR